MPSPSRAAPQIKRARTEASRAREQKAGVGASDVSRPGAHAAPSLQARFGSGGAHLQVEGSAGGAVSSTLWWSEVIHRRAVRCVVDNVLEGRKYARVAKEAKESEVHDWRVGYRVEGVQSTGCAPLVVSRGRGLPEHD